MYFFRTELELLALRWAKSRVTEEDLRGLEKAVEQIIEAAAREKTHLFYERDLDFHRQCWKLSGNKFLSRSLETLVAPLFAFVLAHNQATVDAAGALCKKHAAYRF